MTDPTLEFTRRRIVARARLRAVLDAVSTVHFGQADVRWQGDADKGSFFLDNGQGDALSLAWNRDGLVGLAFAHEAQRTSDRGPRAWLPDLPSSLHALAAATVPPDGSTAGLWLEGDGHGHLSDAVAADTMWASGAEQFVRLGMTAHDAVFADVGQNWLELSSLSRNQGELAMRLAEQSEHGKVTVSEMDAMGILARPDPNCPPSLTRAQAELAREQLAVLGIEFVVPVAAIDAMLRTAEDARTARVEAKSRPDARAILDAARGGDLEALRACIEAGADLDAQTVEEQYEYTPMGDTPLIQALKGKHAACASLLLDAGAKPGPVNGVGQAALDWAVRGNLIAAARRLLDAGAPPSRSEHNGWTPLHHAAAEGFETLVDVLLTHGANTTAKHRGGLTRAEVADLRGHFELAARLRR